MILIFVASFVKVIKDMEIGEEEAGRLVNGVNEVDGYADEVGVVTSMPHPPLRGSVSAPVVQSSVSPLYEEIGDGHPTPSRSAPAPPNSQPQPKQDKVC